MKPIPVLLLLSLAAGSMAKEPPAKLTCAAAQGIKTEAEVQRVSSQKIYNLHVTFIGRKPSSPEVDRVIRDCLSAAIKRDGGKDILASPWFRKRSQDNKNDDELLHPYGSLKFLAYQAKDKSVAVRKLQLRKK